LWQRVWVLGAVADLDPKECAALLLPFIRELPRDAEAAPKTSPAAGVSGVLVKLDDDAVWRAYLAAAKRSSANLRAEMVGSVGGRWGGPRNRERRLAFLAAFLGDEAETDEPARWLAGFRGRVAVGDYAALCALPLLGLDDDWDKSWDAARWAELRRKVRGALVKESLPDLSPR
jgi:hypothetical protein